MSSLRLLLAVALSELIVLGGWVLADPPRAIEPEKAAEAPFHKDLLKVAAEYKRWGRVDDEMRWAPTRCRTPNPGRVQVSASKDEKTHGQKLYSLFASKREEYFSLQKDKTVSVGQIIVKQSWGSEEITEAKDKPARRIEFEKIQRTPDPKPETKGPRFHLDADHFYPYVWKGDKVFKAAKQADLFIMMKLDPKTPATDAGWVYGTVTPDGKSVASAGKVESCMKCHVEAKNERLFGLGK